MAILAIAAQTAVSATGAVGAGADISGITGDFTLHLRVQAASAASGTITATIMFEDTVNAFTATLPVCIADHINGNVNANAPSTGAVEKHFTWRKYQISNLRAGTASAKVRPNVYVLGGTTPSLTIDAWIEY